MFGVRLLLIFIKKNCRPMATLCTMSPISQIQQYVYIYIYILYMFI